MVTAQLGNSTHVKMCTRLNMQQCLQHKIQTNPNRQLLLHRKSTMCLKEVATPFNLLQFEKTFLTFSFLTLLVGRQEGHPACENIDCWW